MISKLKNHSFISQMIMLLLGLVNLKLTIELFGVEQFGLINLYLSILLLFNSIFGFRVWESGIYALNKSVQENTNLKSIFIYFFKLELLINIILAILFLVSLYVYNNLAETKYDIYILALLLIVNVSKDLSNQILVSLDDLRPYYYIRIVQPFILLLLILMFYIFGNQISINTYFIIYIFSMFWMTIVSFIYAYNKKLRFYNSEKYIPTFNVFKFNKNSYLSTTARSFWERTDYLWINFLASSEILGVYAIAKKLVDYINLISFTYWNSIKPSFTKMFDSIKGLNIIKKYQKNTFILFFLVLILMFSLYPFIIDFFNITNKIEFLTIFSFLIIINLFWSLIGMTRYIVTLFNKMRYSLNLNLILAFLLNGSIFIMYFLLNFHNFEIVLISQFLVGLFAYYFWMRKINFIYKDLKNDKNDK